MRPIVLGQRPKSPLPPIDLPDWKQADPQRIENDLRHALKKPSGGWFAVMSSLELRRKPVAVQVNGEEFAVYRTEKGVFAAHDACPHLGARLSEGRACEKGLVCPWHGLTISNRSKSSVPAYDDGVLVWIRPREGVDTTERPFLPVRPKVRLDAVVTMEAQCEPRDILANRLDPWHGAHFHPYSFAALRVVDRDDDSITVRVAKRLLGPFCVESDARFHCPDPRTIVMTIVEGTGEGSVVETHATPLGPGRTLVLEATLATADNPGFAAFTRLAGLVRPWIRRSARRLWVDDIAYAERLYELRRRDLWTESDRARDANQLLSRHQEKNHVDRRPFPSRSRSD